MAEIEQLKLAVGIHGQQWKTIAVHFFPLRSPITLKRAWQALKDSQRLPAAPKTNRPRTIPITATALHAAQKETTTTTTTITITTQTTTTTSNTTKPLKSNLSSSAPQRISTPTGAIPVNEAFEKEDIIDTDDEEKEMEEEELEDDEDDADIEENEIDDVPDIESHVIEAPPHKPPQESSTADVVQKASALPPISTLAPPAWQAPVFEEEVISSDSSDEEEEEEDEAKNNSQQLAVASSQQQQQALGSIDEEVILPTLSSIS